MARGPSQALELVRDIKLAHTVFAMPFAVLAVFLARAGAPPERGQAGGKADGWGVLAGQLVIVVVCMVAARTWAMLVNRLADRRLDAANPRTAWRALAAGRASVRSAGVAAGVSAVVFVVGAAMFGVLYANWLPAILAVPVLLWIAFYSFTKRFTWLCHVFLGGALAASPLAAAIAVRPESLMDTPALWWLAGMVIAWVAGFDVIYALQDLDFDRRVGLRSVPAQFGWRGACWGARALHVLALGALVMAWRDEPRFGALFATGIGVVVLALVFEHAVLARKGREGIPMAFFTLNGVVSVVLGAAGIADVFV